MTDVAFCVCTFNRADNLRRLLPEMLRQPCSSSFDVLVIDNNSNDDTRDIVQEFSKADPRVRYYFESRQGIVHARNRAIEESLHYSYLVFIDDDELPVAGYLEAAIDAMEQDGADCVGGKIEVDFGDKKRPHWLKKELLGFLAEVDYSDEPFWINDKSRPLWTANIGYKTLLFRDDPELRFDLRYNREGDQLGGGEDAAMFWLLVDQKREIRYRPDMVTRHFVDDKRLKVNYFLALHFEAGRKYGFYRIHDYSRAIHGIPLFLFPQLGRHMVRSLVSLLVPQASFVREAMNFTHCAGMIMGAYQRAGGKDRH